MILENMDKFDLFLRKVVRNKLEYKDGIYFSRNTSKISYPKEGYPNCFLVEDNSFWFKHRNNCIIEMINNFPPPGIILDVGAGNGFVSLEIKNNGYKIVLLEPVISCILNAKKRGLEKLICANFNEIDLYPNSISAIGIFDVLEHIQNDYKFLNKIYKCLIPGGKLYVTVPAYNFLWSDEDSKSGHYRRYNLNQLRSIVKQTGLEIEYDTYIFSVLPIPVFLFRTLPTKLNFVKKETNKRTKNEHKIRKGLTGNILQKIWNSEIKAISKEKIIPFGGSCLLVARK